MVTAIKARWRRFRGLLAFGWFLGYFYGDSLREYPLGVGVKMVLARLAFLVPLPFLLPDKRFLLNHHGAKMYRRLNSSPIDWDIASGTYEYWKTRLFCDLAREGMTVLDIGTCEGYYSILLARLMHDKGRVLAFEPDPDNSQWLKKNISANGYKCIEVHDYALSDREGETMFFPGGGTGSLVRQVTDLALLDESRDPVTVRTRTLDNVLLDANIKNVDLMKIDVEGADLLVLKGAQHTLRTMNVRILMDVDVWGNERAELFELLRSCGFSLYRVGRELKPIAPLPEHCIGQAAVASNEIKDKDVAPGRSHHIKNILKQVLPARIRSAIKFLYYRYRDVSIPIRWFKAPQDIREIYAIKTENMARRG